MESLKRNHHTVSKFYLNGFADESRQVRVTRSSDLNRTHIVSTSRASVVRDFYLLKGQDGEITDGLENLFSEVESEGARGFRSLVADSEWPIRFVTRQRIASWAALQHLRSQGIRSIIKDTVQKDVAILSTYGLSHEVVKSGSAEHAAFIRNEFGTFVEEFFLRPWMVIRFESNQLATCDNPIIWGPGNGEDYFARGVYIPMSRAVGLLMGEKGIEMSNSKIGMTVDHQIEGDPHRAFVYNRLVVANAEHEVYTHPDDVHLF